MAKVTQLPLPAMKLGEGPFWLSEQDTLLLVDVFAKGLRTYHVTSGKMESVFFDDPDAHRASLVVPIEDKPDQYLIGLGTSLSLLSLPTGTTRREPIKPQILQKTQDPHFNDGKVDSKGRLWVGTMTYLDETETPAGHEDSSLYKLDLDMTFTKMVDKVTISNGMAWSADNKTFYYVDSKPGLIYGFDFDEEAGTLTNKRVVFNYEKAGLADQVPDGMTIDTDGNLWAACFGGAQVIQVDPRAGKLLRQVAVPSPHVTSVCFGGPDLDTLFVTTGTLRLTPEQLKQYPQAGGTFSITGLGVKGYPSNKFRGDVGKLLASKNKEREREREMTLRYSYRYCPPSHTLFISLSLPASTHPLSHSLTLSKAAPVSTKMVVEVKQIAPAGLQIGEGPHWEASRGCLLFVDILNAEIHRLYTRTGRHQVLRVAPGPSGDTVSFAIPVEGQGDLYVIGQGRSLSLVEWPESDPDLHIREVKVTLHTVEGQKSGNRFNDAKCDPEGRLFAGTMGQQSGPGEWERDLGNLYRLDPDLTLTRSVDKITLSNGLAWSSDHKTFYYIDSMDFAVDAFDYSKETGIITNRRTLFDFKKNGLLKEIPDGMCMDSNGDLWVACFNGGKVIKVNPRTKTLIQEVKLPATNITSVCFGGQDYATLYVTSASTGLTQDDLKKQPAGGTFAVTGLGVTGLPPTAYRVKNEALKVKLG
ncbi:uncharacterized protein LOC126987425 [Eriocheir sinensis]|uniref:uncharacterized protein LOC126987425 n=1 Tax=Eriocheir sinensis TaxID=95602 RepID=UPI0021C7178F|nr:uncharacterized protein LOC126987425 [Eriocheir sinensis]